MDADAADQLKERLSFFNMAGDEDYYPYVRQALNKIGDASLDRFYRMIAAQPHLAEKFTSQEAMNGARRAQVAHWGHLFTGRPTPEYAVRAQHIGKVHSKIGLEPRWYIGGYANVLADIIVHLVKSSPYGRLPGMDRLAKTLVALVRAAMLDMEIAISTYFDSEQAMRNEMLSKFGEAMGRMAQGDLTVNMPPMQGQFGELSDNFNSAIRQLHEAMAAVAYSVEHIFTVARRKSGSRRTISPHGQSVSRPRWRRRRPRWQR
jgi:methyl-accepting chemotaxis protein